MQISRGAAQKPIISFDLSHFLACSRLFLSPFRKAIQYNTSCFCAQTKVPHNSSRKYSKQQFQHSSEWPSGWQKLDPAVRFHLIKLAPNSAPEGIWNGLPPANVYKANKSRKSDRTAAAADIARNDAGQEFDHPCSGGQNFPRFLPAPGRLPDRGKSSSSEAE